MFMLAKMIEEEKHL